MWRQSLSAGLLLISITALTVQGQHAASHRRESRIVAAVRAVLDSQREAWNRGDVAGYMDGYYRSEQTIFVSGDTVTRGWQTVLDRYKKNYDSREKMGTLTFSDLQITLLSPDAVVVLGGWGLKRAKDSPHGRFTLIFRRLPEGWRIVHDHTSAAPLPR